MSNDDEADRNKKAGVFNFPPRRFFSQRFDLCKSYDCRLGPSADVTLEMDDQAGGFLCAVRPHFVHSSARRDACD